LAKAQPLPTRPSESSGADGEILGVFARMSELSKYFRAYCYRPVEEMGFTLNEIDVLVCLKDHPEQNTVKGISECLRLSKGMISQAVESLRRKNLVAVSQSARDRRSVLIALNAKAQPVLDKIRETYSAFIRTFTDGVDREQIALIESVLSQFYQNKEAMKQALRKSGKRNKQKGAAHCGEDNQ
jgi:DNA-binding MarR family transcriptional regulator